MNQWIECNLPWQIRLEPPQTTPFPDMTAAIKAQFGKSKEEFEEEFFPGFHTSQIQFISDHPIFKEYGNVRDELEYDHSDEEVKKLLTQSANQAVQTVLAYCAQIKQIDLWVESQPEYIAACDASDAAWTTHREMEDKLSFCGQKLNRAGTLIRFERDGQLRYIMIGTINQIGGSCNDCRGIDDETIILGYKVLWNGSENQINT